MANVIERAARGQRSALTGVYEANRRRVYYLAVTLLGDPTQAVDVSSAAFRDSFAAIRAGRIATQQGLRDHLASRVVSECASVLRRTNPKAIRIPPNRNFLIPATLCVDDSTEDELNYLLSNLPATQKYIYVLHTAGEMELSQIARILKIDSRTLHAAIDAEQENFRRLQQLSSRGYDSSWDALTSQLLQRQETLELPDILDRQIFEMIDCIAAPLEQRRKRQRYRRTVVCVLLCAALVIGGLTLGWMLHNQAQETGSSEPSGESAGATTLPDTTTAPEATGETELSAELLYYADIEIADQGTITVLLDQAAAPITTANFVRLAQSGFYDGLTFHRIIDGFMMQGGDPDATGAGGSGQTITGEFSDNGYDNPLSHTRGAISMARSSDYNSASSQFFIVHEDSTGLDGQYAVFGYVTEGIEIVDAICRSAEPVDGNGYIAQDEQPVITSITIRTQEKGAEQ